MCELFGFSGRSPRELNQELKEFYSHSNEHPDGWGLALLDEGEISIEKEPMQASESRYLKERLSEPIVSKSVLAHIRYATIGNTEWRNCHPYTGRDSSGRHWTLIHNGTIFDYPELSHFTAVQKGDTDSERILLYFIEQMNRQMKRRNRPLETEERFEVLDDLVTRLAPNNKLNLIVYDGELMYAHCNYANTLHWRKDDSGMYLSTRPLGDGAWRPTPFTTLFALKQGEVVYMGTDHGKEYTVDEEQVKMLYMAYSEL